MTALLSLTPLFALLALSTAPAFAQSGTLDQVSPFASDVSSGNGGHFNFDAIRYGRIYSRIWTWFLHHSRWVLWWYRTSIGRKRDFSVSANGRPERKSFRQRDGARGCMWIDLPAGYRRRHLQS
ncbi:MAG: hypothetical protein HQ519_07075 [Planctomycetes bacterium]|nr:hypothetical protein [Planctomycetota bacterium]